MGLNAFFAYYVCGVLGLHWTVALGAVFFSGIVFLLLTVTHVRQLLIDAVPMNLKYAIVVGIGMFIAFIGLQNAGIVVKNDATVVALGHVTQPGPLLACCGLMLTAGLMARNVQGSLLIGILVTAVLGMVFGVSPAPSGIDSVMSFSLPSLAPTLMAARHHGRAQVRHHFDHLHLHHRRAVRQHGDAHRPLPQSPADG